MAARLPRYSVAVSTPFSARVGFYAGWPTRQRSQSLLARWDQSVTSVAGSYFWCGLAGFHVMPTCGVRGFLFQHSQELLHFDVVEDVRRPHALMEVHSILVALIRAPLYPAVAAFEFSLVFFAIYAFKLLDCSRVGITSRRRQRRSAVAVVRKDHWCFHIFVPPCLSAGRKKSVFICVNPWLKISVFVDYLNSPHLQFAPMRNDFAIGHPLQSSGCRYTTHH